MNKLRLYSFIYENEFELTDEELADYNCRMQTFRNKMNELCCDGVADSVWIDEDEVTYCSDYNLFEYDFKEYLKAVAEDVDESSPDYTELREMFYFEDAVFYGWESYFSKGEIENGKLVFYTYDAFEESYERLDYFESEKLFTPKGFSHTIYIFCSEEEDSEEAFKAFTVDMRNRKMKKIDYLGEWDGYAYCDDYNAYLEYCRDWQDWMLLEYGNLLAIDDLQSKYIDYFINREYEPLGWDTVFFDGGDDWDSYWTEGYNVFVIKLGEIV